MYTLAELYNIFQDDDFINKARIREITRKINNGEKSLEKLKWQNREYFRMIRQYNDEFAVYWCKEELKDNNILIEKVNKRLHFLKKQRLLLHRALKSDEVGKPEEKESVDLDMLKKIPIERVLEMYGISVDRFKKFKVRNEKTASCSFNPTKNLWVDHGNRDYGGSVIDLVIILDGCSVGEAINKLKQYI